MYYGSFNDWISQNGKYIDGEIDKSRYINFEEMKNCLNDENFMVIDVRNPKERTKPGYIPGTKNIPCKYFWYNILGMNIQTKYYCIFIDKASSSFQKIRLVFFLLLSKVSEQWKLL